MKIKITLTIDEELLPKAKKYARMQGVSLSGLVENSLRNLTTPARASFSSRWRGRFEAADREDTRYRELAKKYL